MSATYSPLRLTGKDAAMGLDMSPSRMASTPCWLRLPVANCRPSFIEITRSAPPYPLGSIGGTMFGSVCRQIVVYGAQVLFFQSTFQMTLLQYSSSGWRGSIQAHAKYPLPPKNSCRSLPL